MSRSLRGWTRGISWRGARWGTLALTCLACAKIVGITDTEVTRPDGVVGADLSQGGGAGATTEVSPGAAGMGAPGGLGSGTPGTGSGGQTGGGAQLGSAGAGVLVAGSGGAPAMAGAADAGMGATVEQFRCGTGGREVNTAGEWLPQPCPASAPVCEGAGQCAGGGPALAAVGGLFFIDATEVTVAQYRRFLTEKNGDVSGQIAACSWNDSYYDEGVAFEPDNEPITMVDWCDANAFCTWAHKRMCGRIGGGAVTTAELADPAQSQWYLACGGPNGNLYSTDSRDGCNLSDGFESVAPVASFPGCEGYYPSIFDLRGNVWEWVDDCETNAGPDDICAPMGGSTITNDSANCSYFGETTGEDAWRRNDRILYAGIRCCAD